MQESASNHPRPKRLNSVVRQLIESLQRSTDPEVRTAADEMLARVDTPVIPAAHAEQEAASATD
ncbi:hypothetical protein [Prosthecobacter sp.]|uniref:hypothetical protein n=1 Tax=Prosthecobacter sp. TaxID=1965333 RepID=UPI0037832809